MNLRFIRHYASLVIACTVYVVLSLCFSHTGFFWDSSSILSYPATYLYENGFSNFSFPAESVSDNLPVSMLLAGWWIIFGRTCLSTHILFMLFGIGNIVQIFLLCRDMSPVKRAIPYIFLLALSDTALVTQLVFPMFDNVMLFFLLLALRAILCRFSERNTEREMPHDKKFQGSCLSIILWTVFLAMMRSRGVIFCSTLGLFYGVLAIEKARSLPVFTPSERRNTILKAIGETILLFLPALAMAAVLFYIQFICQAEVFGLGKQSPWQFAAPSVVLRHVFGFIRFMLEYNKFFLWIVLIWCFFVWRKNHAKLSISVRNLMLACVLFLVSCMLISIPFINPFGPHYFLVLFVLIPLLTGILVFSVLSFKKARLCCLFLSLMLWCGHFWHYPETISTSWDTTLAHVPYYSLRQEVIDYLDSSGIQRNEVHSFFPMVKADYYIDLKGSIIPFAQHEPVSPDTCRYRLVSNIANVGHVDRAEIESCYEKIRQFKKGQVYIDLYRRFR